MHLQPFSVCNTKSSFQIHLCDCSGEIKVGATRRFLLFGSPSEDAGVSVDRSEISPSLFNGIPLCAVDVGVSGGVPKGGTAPPDEIDGFRFIPGYIEDDDVMIEVGRTNVDVGEGADKAAGGTCEIFGVVEAKLDNVATEEEELDLVGLEARPPVEGVGKEGLEVVEGDGRE